MQREKSTKHNFSNRKQHKKEKETNADQDTDIKIGSDFTTAKLQII